MPAVVDESLCSGCEACVSSCPSEVITINDGKAKIGDGCIDCGSCESTCPSSAISMK